MNTVIFDMDGLMFDTERVFMQSWDYAGEKIGIGKAGYMTLKTMGMSLAMSRDIWVAEFGEKYDEEKLRFYSREFRNEYYEKNKVPVKKGLYVLLEYLKEQGYKLAVASSSSKWEVEHHLKDAGIYEYFRFLACGDMVEKSKPEPDIFLLACNGLGEAPNNCIALEDSRNGILSAYRAGCRPIMVPDLVQPDEEIMKILWKKCDDLEEVKRFLEVQNVQ